MANATKNPESPQPDSTVDMFDFSVLRELRKREGLTIEEVSERSGVSSAVISRLERNQAQAELSTLYRLSRVYAINVADLISLSEFRSSHRAEETSYTTDGIRFRRIAYNQARCMYAIGRKGACLSRPEVHRDDYEICWVVAGAVLVTLPNEKQRLDAGQSLMFDAILGHGYEVLEDCTMIIQHISKGRRLSNA